MSVLIPAAALAAAVGTVSPSFIVAPPDGALLSYECHRNLIIEPTSRVRVVGPVHPGAQVTIVINRRQHRCTIYEHPGSPP